MLGSSRLSLWTRTRTSKAFSNWGRYYLLHEFKKIKETLPLKQCNILFTTCLNFLVSIDFVKFIPRSLFLIFSSCQTAHNLVGQKRPFPLSALFFLNWLYHHPSCCLQSSSQIISFLWQKASCSETAGRNCWKVPLSTSPCLILTYLVLLWKSWLPEIRWINKWCPTHGVHHICCGNLEAKIYIQGINSPFCYFPLSLLFSVFSLMITLIGSTGVEQ